MHRVTWRRVERGARPQLAKQASADFHPASAVSHCAAGAITTVPSEIDDCSIIMILAQRDSTGTSVGENAVLVLNARNR